MKSSKERGGSIEVEEYRGGGRGKRREEKVRSSEGRERQREREGIGRVQTE